MARQSKGIVIKGVRDGRILPRFKFIGGVKYVLHATKGWRKA